MYIFMWLKKTFTRPQFLFKLEIVEEEYFEIHF